jgi:hypothetical protein
MFGGKDHHYYAAPISDGVAEERADMPFLVAHAIKHDPGQEDATTHNRKSVPFKERLVLFFAQSKFHNRHLNPNLNRAVLNKPLQLRVEGGSRSGLSVCFARSETKRRNADLRVPPLALQKELNVNF